jgi:DNA-binding MarR family transcriptional regulator
MQEGVCVMNPRTLYEQHLLQNSNRYKYDYQVYMAIKDNGPLKIRQILSKAGCTSNTLRAVLYRLNTNGMIRRKITLAEGMRSVRYFVDAKDEYAQGVVALAND